MAYSESYEKIEFLCGHDGCEFKAEVKNPNDLTEQDIDLLNQLLNPEFVPTTEQEARLKELLGDQYACPTHDRTKAGFLTTEKITASSEFIIEFGETEEGDIRLVISPE